MAVISESLMGIDIYNNPKVVKNEDALAILLIRLLIMEPGTDRLHPEMGIDAPGRFNYSFEDDISDLQDEIAKQIATYLPNYQNSEIECTNEDGELHLKITVDDTVFSYTTSETPEEGEISLRPMA